MEFELINGIYKPIAPRFDPLSQKEKWCARYARKASLDLLIGSECNGQELWTPSDTWNFGYKNHIAWKIEKGKPFDASKLKPGQILGIKIPYSEYNKRRDERNNPAQFTHLATYVSKSIAHGRLNHWIVHNLAGVILSEDLNSFLDNTGSSVMAIFSPRNKSILNYH